MLEKYNGVRFIDFAPADKESRDFLSEISWKLQLPIELWFTFEQYKNFKELVCDSLKNELPMYEKYNGMRLFRFKPTRITEYLEIFTFVFAEDIPLAIGFRYDEYLMSLDILFSRFLKLPKNFVKFIEIKR